MLTLIPNRPAAARADAPDAIAAATRARKSPEYGAGTSSPNDMLRHHHCRSALSCKSLSCRIYSVGNRSNVEGQQRQHELVNVARQRGFRESEMIDEDLGRSASGLVEWPRLAAFRAALVGSIPKPT